MLSHKSVWGVCAVLILQAAQAPAAIQISPLRTLVPEIRSEEGTGQVADTLREASKQFQAGKLDKCFELLESAKNTQANLPPARLMLARLFLSTNRVREARPELERAAADEPGHPAVYLTFGKLAFAEGRLTDGIAHLEMAARLSAPASWSEEQERFLQIQIAAGRAMVSERREHWDAARTALTDWVKLEPDNATAHHRLAGALFQLDRAEESLRELQRAVELNESLEPAAVSMGWLHDRKGDRKAAEEWMVRAVTTTPDDARAHLGYASWLVERGRFEEAGAHADTAGKLDPDNPKVSMLRGLIARGLRRYEEAERLFLQVHQQLPADFEPTNQLALVLAEQEDEAKRQQALQLALLSQRQYPRESAALSTLGWVHYRLGNVEEAKRLLHAATARAKTRSESCYFLARILTEQGDAEEADEARRILHSRLNDPGVFVLRASATEWLGRQDNALSNSTSPSR